MLASIVGDTIRWLTAGARWHGAQGIPTRLVEHMAISGAVLVLALALALPLGLWLGHRGRGATAVVAAANVARAVPSFGLIVLGVVAFGIGVGPVILALVVLAVPPILVNTYQGIRGVDADLKDAARGMGMTGGQVLLGVEIPSALPLILLGLRTAALQIVSTATIAAYVSLGGLGRFVFDGLARRDYPSVAGGAVLAAFLAVSAEVVFVLMQRVVVSPGIRQRG